MSDTPATPEPTPDAEVFFVACASDTIILEGPDLDHRALLRKVEANSDYQGFSDQPIVVSFRGPPEAIAALARLTVSAWVDDPRNYEEDDLTNTAGSAFEPDPPPAAAPDLTTQMLNGTEPNPFTMFP